MLVASGSRQRFKDQSLGLTLRVQCLRSVLEREKNRKVLKSMCISKV